MLRRGVESVACIACGACVDASEAHEYDKRGDGERRPDESVEYLCASCHGELSTADREGLEPLLCRLHAGEVSTHEFLVRYADALEADR